MAHAALPRCDWPPGLVGVALAGRAAAGWAGCALGCRRGVVRCCGRGPRRSWQTYAGGGLAKLVEQHLSQEMVPAIRLDLVSAMDGARPSAAGADESLLRSTLTASRLLLRCRHLPAELATLAQQTVKYVRLGQGRGPGGGSSKGGYCPVAFPLMRLLAGRAQSVPSSDGVHVGNPARRW